MELIKIEQKRIGDGEINSVDARELHTFLENGYQFSKWITERIKQYEFTEGVDFITIVNSYYSPPRKDYIISINMAKELSMVERNEKGKQARRYFIEMEDVAKKAISRKTETPSQLPEWAIEGQGVANFLSRYNAPEHMVATEEAKHIKKIGGPDLSQLVGLLPCCQNIKDEEKMLEPKELAAKLGVKSAIEVNKKLSALGLQAKTDEGWIATEKGKPFSMPHAWSKGPKSGYNLKWNLSEIKKLLK